MMDRIRGGSLRAIVVPAVALYVLAWLPFLALPASGEMIRLQYSGSETSARAVLGGLSASERADLAFLVGLDHVHLVLYGVLLIAGALWVGRRSAPLARWSRPVAWMASAACVFDVLENLGLLVMIRGRLDDPSAPLTRVASITKVVLLLAAVAFVLAGAMTRRRTPADSE
jgi:hypothetical protein